MFLCEPLADVLIARGIEDADMVVKRKADLLRIESIHPHFEESDFACHSEEEIRRFAFDIRSLFLIDGDKHLAICTRCQARLESCTKLVEKFVQRTATHNGWADA